MDDPLLAASSLRREADILLSETGLLSLLEKHGTVFVTGSYSYDLMTWRDIDLCLVVPTIDVRSIFDLGRDIDLCLVVPTIDVRSIFDLGRDMAVFPGVGSMYYRNEFIMGTPGNPRAVFWCVEFYYPREVKWKVDILISLAEEVARVLQPGRDLKARLTPGKRKAILGIKDVLTRRSRYRQEYGSRAVYEAVMEHGIRTIEEWDAWWKQRNG